MIDAEARKVYPITVHVEIIIKHRLEREMFHPCY